MMTKLCMGLAMAAGLGIVSPAIAQDDDWDLQEDPARRLSVAAVRYDAGQTIIVQCREGALTAVLLGLPPSAEPLTLVATRADGRSGLQRWTPAGAPGAYMSADPGRNVRFMRGGGAYSLRTAAGAPTPFRGEFDLPAQSVNLDRVLTGCGWAVTDDRDGLASAGDAIAFRAPDGQRRASRTPSRSVGSRPRLAAPPAAPAPTAPPPPELWVSCIVRALHLRECRADHPASAQLPGVLFSIRTHEGMEVDPAPGADAAASEGKVIHVVGSRVRVSVEYLGTAPAG
jgi:hypothetical protein